MATTRASSLSPSRSRPRRSTAVSRRTAGLQRRALEKVACSFVSTALLLSAQRLEQGTWGRDRMGLYGGRRVTRAERREELGVAGHLCFAEQGWLKEVHWPGGASVHPIHSLECAALKPLPPERTLSSWASRGYILACTTRLEC